MLVDEPPPSAPHFCLAVDDARRAAGAARGGRASRPRDATPTRRPAALHLPRPVREPDRARSDRADDRRADRPRRRDDRRQGRRDLAGGRAARDRRGALPALDAAGPAGPSRIPRTGGGPRRPCSRGCPKGPVGFSGQMHGLVALGAGDRVLRPAILWNDQRTGAECAEIERRIGLERLIELTGNRALTGFTAPKLLWLAPARAGDLRPDPADPAAEGLRPPPADRGARDRRRRRLGDAALRRRRAGAGRRRSAPRSRCRSNGCRRAFESTEIARSRRPGGRRARRRDRRAWPRLGRARDLGCRVRRASRVRARPRGARPRLLPCRAGHVARDGRDALGRGLVRVAAEGRSAPAYGELDEEAERWEPGAEGLLFAPYLQGERTPHADPDVRGAFTGSLAPARPRRARTGGARGRRLRPAGLARAPAGARRTADRRPRVGRRRAQRALAADRRLGARPAARADGVRGGLSLRRGAARRRAGGCVRRRGRGRRPLRPRRATASTRSPPGSGVRERI